MSKSSLKNRQSPEFQWRGKKCRNGIPKVIHFDFPSAFDVGSVFLRPQEFYESEFEDIRGQVFTWEYFMDRYAMAKGGFTYFEDWGGFNLPDTIIRDFFQSFGSQLTQKETWLKEALSEELKSPQKFYVIATFQARPDIIAHEEAHALFYLNEHYQADQLENVSLLRQEVQEEARRWLLDIGYGEAVLADEIQAYASTSSLQWLKETWGMTRTQADRFREVFKRYKPKSPKAPKKSTKFSQSKKG